MCGKNDQSPFFSSFAFLMEFNKWDVAQMVLVTMNFIEGSLDLMCLRQKHMELWQVLCV